MALTFMAKPNAREGNSCHIHFSLRSSEVCRAVMVDGHGRYTVGEQVVAGLLARVRELTLLYAPNVNSYKLYQPGSFATVAVRWGRDNRTCSLRLVGHSPVSTR